MKKLNLTDKRNPDYFYSEAIKTLRTNIGKCKNLLAHCVELFA